VRALSEPVHIRAAQRADVPLVLSLVRELAGYERAADQVLGTEELLAEALFGADPVAETLIAEVAGRPAGFALFYRTFSTWLCLPGLWLEDLYVSPAHRRTGVGRALLAHLAGIALDRGYGRLEWSALGWNTPALDFYSSIGATELEEWQQYRLTGASLREAAAGRGA
jgi:GNAT superfamily N-acetyltransferase